MARTGLLNIFWMDCQLTCSSSVFFWLMVCDKGYNWDRTFPWASPASGEPHLLPTGTFITISWFYLSEKPSIFCVGYFHSGVGWGRRGPSLNIWNIIYVLGLHSLSMVGFTNEIINYQTYAHDDEEYSTPLSLVSPMLLLLLPSYANFML